MSGLSAAIAGLIAVILFAIFGELTLRDAQQPAMRSSGNNCAAAYYPASAIRAGEQGATLLNLSISKTGTVTKVEVKQSSGFADLDKAAVDCVMGGWHFHPALQKGKPLASTKKIRIVWKLMSRGNVAPHLQTPMETSCANDFPANKWTSYRSTVLHFRILADGTVSQPFVAISSGDSLFDAKAMQCATRLTYTAAVINEAPADVSWNAAVDWSPRTGLAYTDAYKLGVFCFDRYFPAKIWNGDPANSTIISFRLVEGGVAAHEAIERSSGNPALDQAALECIRAWRSPYRANLGPSADIGEVVRIDWRNGHAFPLLDTWQ
jgi:TonB family protein